MLFVESPSRKNAVEIWKFLTAHCAILWFRLILLPILGYSVWNFGMIRWSILCKWFILAIELLLRSCGPVSTDHIPCYNTHAGFLFDFNRVKNKMVTDQVESEIEGGKYCCGSGWACDGTIQWTNSKLDKKLNVWTGCPAGWLKCGGMDKCEPETRKCDWLDDCVNGLVHLYKKHPPRAMKMSYSRVLGKSKIEYSTKYWPIYNTNLSK